MKEGTVSPAPQADNNPLKTNETLQYGIMIALLVVLSVILFFRKRKNK